MRSLEELEAILDDPLADDAVVREAETERRTLLAREAGTLKPTESYALDAHGKEYVVNEFGICEPDIASDNPGSPQTQTEELPDWEAQCVNAEKTYALNNGISPEQVDVFWRSIRPSEVHLNLALMKLREQIDKAIDARIQSSDLPNCEGIPWELAKVGAFEEIIDQAKLLGIDAFTVSSLWSNVCLRQGGNTHTNFAHFCLRLSIERHFAVQQLAALSSEAQSAMAKLKQVGQQRIDATFKRSNKR